MTKIINLDCTVPVEFDFEFKFLKYHQDVSISPMSGEIENGKVPITISFTPSSATTVSLEVQLKISEFDFTPEVVKIIGSGVHEVVQRNKTLLAQKKETMEKTKPKKLPELDRTVTKKSNTVKTGNKPAAAIVTVKNEVDRTIVEQQFSNEYLQLEQFDIQKEFKIFQCPGDPNITYEATEEINTKRLKNFNRVQDKMYNGDCGRNEVETNIATFDLTYVTTHEPSWDEYKNDDFTLRKLSLIKFVRAVNVVIKQQRVAKRLMMLKNRLADFGVTSRKKARNFVEQDWKTAEMTGIGNSDFIGFTVPDVEIFSNRLFPQQDEGDTSQFRELIEIEPMTAFDDLEPFDLIEIQDFELVGHKDYEAPAGAHYLPIENFRDYRATAEEEYFVSTKRGEELEAPNGYEIPDICLKRGVTDPVAQVRKHPTIRNYCSLATRTETEIDFEPKRFTRDTNWLEMHPTAPLLSTKWRPTLVHSQVKMKKLDGPSSADVLSDSDSESNNDFVMPVNAFEALMDKFEKDDEVLDNIKSFNNARENATQDICAEIKDTRTQQSAKIPTSVTEANTKISNLKNKISLT